jgi:YggT family protein
VSFLRTFLSFFFVALELIILGRVLMSWVDPAYRNPLGRFLFETSEPFLRPIRSVLPSTGTLDLSPIVAFLVIGVIAGALGVR